MTGDPPSGSSPNPLHSSTDPPPPRKKNTERLGLLFPVTVHSIRSSAPKAVLCHFNTSTPTKDYNLICSVLPASAASPSVAAGDAASCLTIPPKYLLEVFVAGVL